MADHYVEKYGSTGKIYFELYAPNGLDLESAASFAVGDLKLMKDGGAEANPTNLPTDEGQGYSWVPAAADLQCGVAVLYLADQTSPKVWIDKVLIVSTHGNTSAKFSVDFDDGVRAGLTALPNAAADAAGGLAISDAGGLDLDTTDSNVSAILTDTAEIGIAGAGLTDLGGMSTGMKGEVNAEVADVVRTDTASELAAVPAASPALHTMIQWIYQKLRNKETSSATAATIANDAGTAIGTSTLSDDGTTFTKGEYS
jgi:hypothetical protein